MICAFVAEHRARFGVAPICRVLSEHGCQIAPRTFYAWASRAPSKRALSDLTLTRMLAGYYQGDDSFWPTVMPGRVEQVYRSATAAVSPIDSWSGGRPSVLNHEPRRAVWHLSPDLGRRLPSAISEGCRRA